MIIAGQTPIFTGEFWLVHQGGKALRIAGQTPIFFYAPFCTTDKSMSIWYHSGIYNIMPYGTSKDWDLFNTEERDRRELLRGDLPYWESDSGYELQGLPDNYYIARAYVMALNRSMRPRSLPFPYELRERFKDSLKSANVCWQCKLPVRTVRSSVWNGIYADIRPHFDIRMAESGRRIFVLVDGGSLKLVEDAKARKIVFLDLATQQPIKGYRIPRFYRVLNKKCVCKR